MNRWFTAHFPRAYSTGRALQLLGQPGVGLKFTAQSWLVSMYLECPPSLAALGLQCPNATERAQFLDAVQQGFITWHAFPFNVEAEVCLGCGSAPAPRAGSFFKIFTAVLGRCTTRLFLSLASS